jgi:hypothetical protein
MWYGCVAAAKLNVCRDTEAIELVCRAVRQEFGITNVHIEIFDRTRIGSDGKIYELVQATFYREGRLDTALEFVDGMLDRRSRRPVIEAALTYEPATGVIEVVASRADNRDWFVDIFARELLNYRIGKKRLPLRRYDLKQLLHPNKFLTDPEDGIESVHVTLLRLMPLDAEGERVTFECERGSPENIWQMAAKHFGFSNPLHGGWIATKAKLVVCFRAVKGAGRGRVLPVTITLHGCDLKERTERERIVGDKYLRSWGLLKNA